MTRFALVLLFVSVELVSVAACAPRYVMQGSCTSIRVVDPDGSSAGSDTVGCAIIAPRPQEQASPPGGVFPQAAQPWHGPDLTPGLLMQSSLPGPR